jgi:hypothetical protein
MQNGWGQRKQHPATRRGGGYLQHVEDGNEPRSPPLLRHVVGHDEEHAQDALLAGAEPSLQGRAIPIIH